MPPLRSVVVAASVVLVALSILSPIQIKRSAVDLFYWIKPSKVDYLPGSLSEDSFNAFEAAFQPNPYYDGTDESVPAQNPFWSLWPGMEWPLLIVVNRKPGIPSSPSAIPSSVRSFLSDLYDAQDFINKMTLSSLVSPVELPPSLIADFAASSPPPFLHCDDPVIYPNPLDRRKCSTERAVLSAAASAGWPVPIFRVLDPVTLGGGTLLQTIARDTNLLPTGYVCAEDEPANPDAFVATVTMIYTSKKACYWLNDAFEYVAGRHRAALEADGYAIGMTSQYEQLRDVAKAIRESFGSADSIVVPMSVAILASQIGFKSALTVFLTLSSSVAITFSILNNLITVHEVVIPDFGVSLIAALLLALSVDYTLFLFTRFNQERSTARLLNVPDPLSSPALLFPALRRTLASAGHAVLSSGVILASCWLLVTLTPQKLLTGLGLSCSVTILVTVGVHLTLLPAILIVAAAVNEWRRPMNPLSETSPSFSFPSSSSSSSSFSSRYLNYPCIAKLLGLRRSVADTAASALSSIELPTRLGGSKYRPGRRYEPLSTAEKKGELNRVHKNSADSFRRLVDSPDEGSLDINEDDDTDAYDNFNSPNGRVSPVPRFDSEEWTRPLTPSSSQERLSSLVSDRLRPFSSTVAYEEPPNSRWVKWALLIAKRPGQVLVGVAVLSAPFIGICLAPNSPFLALSMSMDHLSPSNAPGKILIDSFNGMGLPKGLMSPHPIMVCSTDGSSVYTRDIPSITPFFSALHDVVDVLTNPAAMGSLAISSRKHIVSIAAIGGMPITPTESVMLVSIAREFFQTPKHSSIWSSGNIEIMLDPSRSPNLVEGGEDVDLHLLDRAVSYSVLIEPLISLDGKCVKALVYGSHADFDEVSFDWVKKAREALDEGNPSGEWWQRNPGFSIHLLGQAPRNLDAIRGVFYGFRPVLVVLGLVGLFVLSTLTFRTPVLAVRLVLSSVYTVLLSFGLASLLFGTKLVRAGDAVAFYWLICVTMIIIIAGLTLDYDLFLITRVVEHLTSGYDVPSAMALALSDTGPSITAAGLVMVISFGALLLPDVPVINEFGAVLVIASCVDAFLVRCVIVPAFATWGGMRGFYPRKFEVSKTLVRG